MRLLASNFRIGCAVWSSALDDSRSAVSSRRARQTTVVSWPSNTLSRRVRYRPNGEPFAFEMRVLTRCVKLMMKLVFVIRN